LEGKGACWAGELERLSSVHHLPKQQKKRIGSLKMLEEKKRNLTNIA
jgi:hypothetical protein